MIKITDIAGASKYLNCDLIERMESTPDTVICLVNGCTIIVRETPDEIIDRILEFKRRCFESSNHLPEIEPGRQIA